MGIEDVWASKQDILAGKYFTNMGINVIPVSVKNVLACKDLLQPWILKTYEQVHKIFLHVNTSHPRV